jgi:hypothetical protein
VTMRATIPLLLLATLTACRDSKQAADESSDHRSVSRKPPTRSFGDSAQGRLAQYLESKLLLAEPRVDTSLVTCKTRVMGPAPRLALAAYRVLSATRRADTAHVVSEIVTVAREGPDPRTRAYTVWQGVSRDTLTWLLVRSSQHPAWRVCLTTGSRFMSFGAEGRDHWAPSTASWQSLHQLYDSVRATGGS